MNLGLGFRMSLEHRFEQTMQQRLETRQEMMLRILQELRMQCGINWVSTPKAECPDCGRILIEEEILNGFTDDPYDYHTKCPDCGTKFLAELIIKDPAPGKKGRKKILEAVTYYCKIQTLVMLADAMKNRTYLGLKYLAKNYRPLFYNVIRHWGTYDLMRKELTEYLA